MPRVGGKEYPYTPAGMASADSARKKKKRMAAGAKNSSSPKKRSARSATPDARKRLKSISSPNLLKNTRAYGRKTKPKSRRGMK